MKPLLHTDRLRLRHQRPKREAIGQRTDRPFGQGSVGLTRLSLGQT